jgi:hypothetical protein
MIKIFYSSSPLYLQSPNAHHHVDLAYHHETVEWGEYANVVLFAQ